MIDLTRYFGKKFKDDGRGPDEFDCLGLLEDIYKQRGIILPDWSRPDTLHARNCAIVDNSRQWQAIDKAEPWCAVAIAVMGPNVSHVGVVIDDCTRFIHITEKTGVSVDLLKSPIWINRIKGFYRWPHQT